MKIVLSDIPPEGLEIEAESSSALWLANASHEAFHGDFRAGSGAEAAIQILRTDDNVAITGTVSVRLTPGCHRCLDPFPLRHEVPIHLTLAPIKDLDGKVVEDNETVAEDEGFSLYKGDGFDLGEIIREALVLSIPFRYLCKEDCRGLCPRCGENLNQTACVCKRDESDRPFAVLKRLLVILIACLLSSVAFGETSKKWSSTGKSLLDRPLSQGDFFVSGGPHIGAEVHEIKRALSGLGFRFGYGLTDRFFLYLQNDWTFSWRTNVFFHFFDFYPHVACALGNRFYLMAGGGYTLARNSSGTTVDGFSRITSVRRGGFGADGGFGIHLFQHEDLSISLETKGLYRKISGGNFFEAILNPVLRYRF